MRRTTLAKNILFLSEDNPCLGLMAEAMAKHMGPPGTRIFSASARPGTIPAEVRQVLQEIGVNLSASTTKSLDQIPVKEIDLVVALGEAASKCDSLPKNTRIEKWSLPNPLRADGGNSTPLSSYRNGRDEIDIRLAALFLDHWRHVV